MDNKILGLFATGGLLQSGSPILSSLEPTLRVVYVAAQILVALSTVILIWVKIRKSK